MREKGDKRKEKGEKGATLGGASTGAWWSNSTCPDGSNSNAPDGDGRTCDYNRQGTSA